jgi:hypothetical protein
MMNIIYALEGELPNYPAEVNFKFANKNLAEVINQLMPYIFGFAGLALFVVLIWGGITLMTAAGDPAKSKSGYGKISAGLIGFLIIFVSYFVAQIVEVVLGVKIL